MEKAFLSLLAGATVVALIPARTDTKYWHRFAMKGEIRLLRGRIKFVGGKHSAPFPSAIIVFRPPGFKIASYQNPENTNCKSKKDTEFIDRLLDKRDLK